MAINLFQFKKKKDPNWFQKLFIKYGSEQISSLLQSSTS